MPPFQIQDDGLPHGTLPHNWKLPPDLAQELLVSQQDRKAKIFWQSKKFSSLKHHFEAMSASGQYGSSMMFQGLAC